MGGAISDICKLSTLQIRNSVVQALFSVTFALSCTMFELIIFEIVGIMDTRYNALASVYVRCTTFWFIVFLHSSRSFHWRFDLYLMLLILIVINPFYIANQISRNLRFSEFDLYVCMR